VASTWSAGAKLNYFEASLISGPSQIAASESVSAKFETGAGQSLANGTEPVIDFGTKVYDSHGAVQTGANWRFIAPISGVYRMNFVTLLASATFTSGTNITARVYKNGSGDSIPFYKNVTATGTDLVQVKGTAEIKLLAGEYIDLRISHGESSARSLVASAPYNYIEITRVANY
jgi:hypothetical protein